MGKSAVPRQSTTKVIRTHINRSQSRATQLSHLTSTTHHTLRTVRSQAVTFLRWAVLSPETCEPLTHTKQGQYLHVQTTSDSQTILSRNLLVPPAHSCGVSLFTHLFHRSRAVGRERRTPEEGVARAFHHLRNKQPGATSLKPKWHERDQLFFMLKKKNLCTHTDNLSYTHEQITILRHTSQTTEAPHNTCCPQHAPKLTFFVRGAVLKS